MVIAVCEDDRIFMDGMRIAIASWMRCCWTSSFRTCRDLSSRRGFAGQTLISPSSSFRIPTIICSRGTRSPRIDTCASRSAARRSKDCLDHCYQYSLTVQHEGVLQSDIHSVRVFTRDGAEHAFPLKGSFESFAQAFPQDSFLRCHKGYVFNLMHVSKFSAKTISLCSGAELLIGRVYAREAQARLREYFFREALQ